MLKCFINIVIFVYQILTYYCINPYKFLLPYLSIYEKS